MPSAADTLLFSPDCRVTLTALKWSGAAVRFGSLVAATTVRVIADWAGVVCATQGAGSTIAPSNIIPIVPNCMPASQFKGSPNYHTLSESLLEWPAALAAIGWLQCACWDKNSESPSSDVLQFDLGQLGCEQVSVPLNVLLRGS